MLDDDQQRQVLALPPSAFDHDRGTWGIVRTELYHLRGDRARTAVYADSARLAFEEQSRAAPEDGTPRAARADPGLSGTEGGGRARGPSGGRALPISQDAYLGPYVQLQLVRIYLLTGEPEQALDQLEPLLRMPFYLSPAGSGSIPPSIPLEQPAVQEAGGGEIGCSGRAGRPIKQHGTPDSSAKDPLWHMFRRVWATERKHLPRRTPRRRGAGEDIGTLQGCSPATR